MRLELLMEIRDGCDVIFIEIALFSVETLCESKANLEKRVKYIFSRDRQI